MAEHRGQALIESRGSPAARGTPFRRDIEGLRGVAVLCVVLFHAGVPGMAGGFVGVDVFFVLSGYLITRLLLAEHAGSGHLALGRFYARRVRRLLPAATCVTLTTLAVGVIMMAPAELTDTARAARATSAYLSNYFFALNAENYFAPGVRHNPILHTWSLALEEQFYLFWPFVILATRWRSRTSLATWGVIGGGTLLSFALCIVQTDAGATFAFYGLPARAWEFGAGALASAPLVSRWTRIPWHLARWAGIGIIALATHYYSAATTFPGVAAALPVAGTMLSLAAGEHETRFAWPLDTKLFQMLGRLSYSWYLWHWPFLVFAEALFPGIGLSGNLLVLALALAAAAATYWGFENKVRFAPGLRARPRLTFAMGAVLMIATLGASLASLRIAKRLSDSPRMLEIATAANDMADIPLRQCVNERGSTTARTCTLGDTGSRATIVLFGDSHAVQWLTPLHHVAESHGWKVVTFLRWGCPASDVALPASLASARGCAGWRAASVKAISSLHPAAIVVANGSLYVSRAHGAESTPMVPFPAWTIGTRATLASFRRSVPVLLLRDTPAMGFDIPSCLARAARNTWYSLDRCTAPRGSALDTRLQDADRAAVAGLPNVSLLDVSDSVCSPTACPPVIKGIIAYRDDNHLSGAMARSLGSSLESGLLAAMARAK